MSRSPWVEDSSYTAPPLVWLSPFWARRVSLTVPEDIDECVRRLEPLAGSPKWFESKPTSGRVGRDGFRLVMRFRNNGIYLAVAVASGTLRAHDEGTRVDFRVRYAPFPLIWAAAVSAGLAWMGLLGWLEGYWVRFFAVVIPVSWVGGLWITQQMVHRLIEGILDSLDPRRVTDEGA